MRRTITSSNSRWRRRRLPVQGGVDRRLGRWEDASAVTILEERVSGSIRSRRLVLSSLSEMSEFEISSSRLRFGIPPTKKGKFIRSINLTINLIQQT
ncbi:hypothetical protein LINPERPRIM_LOCUS13730 [Linum perenne]